MRDLIFGLDVLGKTVLVFGSKEQAVAAIEGLAVAEGDWRFFSSDGSPLEARFSVPAEIYFDRGTYTNGTYSLEAGSAGPTLQSILAAVECQDEANSGLLTLRDVEQFLIDRAIDKEPG